MKKICASTLSANGIDPSKTRRRLMGVVPTSGAASTDSEREAAERQDRHGEAPPHVSHGGPCGAARP